MENYSQNQRERLNYLEFRIFFTGQISRADLMQRFGISEAAATRDFTMYRENAAGNIEFDNTNKIYRISSSFKRHFLKDVDDYELLRALVHGVGNGFGAAPEIMVSCEFPSRMHPPRPEILASISRAICQGKVLQIEYLSDSGNHGLRQIVPLSLAGTGLKWMVRAYNRRKNIFGEFIINRIKSAEILEDEIVKETETKEYDDEWNRMLNLELIAHPAASPEKRERTEQEFRMQNGIYTLRVRAALAGYLLRLWSVDCSENQSKIDLPLCIKDRLSLYNVENAKIAPGYLGENA